MQRQIKGQPGLHSTFQDNQGYILKTCFQREGAGIKRKQGEEAKWKEMSACCYGVRICLQDKPRDRRTVSAAVGIVLGIRKADALLAMLLKPKAKGGFFNPLLIE